MNTFCSPPIFFIISGWSGLLAEALWSNSVVLRQDPKMSSWFGSMLIPWTHYIPVLFNLTDLIFKIEWAKAHPVECQQISEASTAFALKYWNVAAQWEYTYTTFEKNMPRLLPVPQK